jgi:hypothetical protein
MSQTTSDAPTAPAPQPPVSAPGSDFPIHPQPEPIKADPTPQAARPPQPAPPPPAPSVPFAPRSFNKKKSPNSDSLGLSPLLEIAAPAPWTINKDDTLNTFLPCFHGLAYAISTCDDLMASTYRFTRSHPHWIPRMTTIYIAMLFHFRVIESMVQSGYATAKTIQLRKTLRNRFDFRSLMVPGPLVPYLQALSYCASNDDLLGNISSTLPMEHDATSTNFWSYQDHANRYLPNILALLDYPTSIIARQGSFPDDFDLDRLNRYETFHSVNVNAQNQANIIQALTGPGFYTDNYEDLETLNTFKISARSRLRLPRRIDQAAVEQAHPGHSPSWEQFLRLERLPGEPASPTFRVWFGLLSAMMADYSDYFSGSKPLEDIPFAAGAQPHLTFTYEESTPDLVTPAAVPTFHEAAN